MLKMNFKSIGIVLALLVSVSAAQYYFGPKKVEYKEKIKLVEVERVEVRTITRNEKRSDGTQITTITKEEIKEDKKDLSKEVEKKVTPIKKDWFVTGTYSIDDNYSLAVQRRILFDIYAGVYARSDKEIGLAVSFQF